MQPIIKSPLNYIGGKYKLLPQILPLFPDDIDTFIDLFCGGCNVGVNISSKKVIFNDNLTYLIDMYKAFQAQSKENILNHIDGQIRKFNLSLSNKDGYVALRDLYNTDRNPLDLFVLIAYSFNHQIRFNGSHRFTTPFGAERSCYNASMKTNLEAFLDRFHTLDYTFRSGNFDEWDLSFLSDKDFVYCDPPYLITTGSYNDGKRGFTGWGKREEGALLDLLSGLDQRGVRFALSNVLEHKGKSNDMLKQWAADNNYTIHYLNQTYSNSNYHSKFEKDDITIEVLITNYGSNCGQGELF